MRALICREYGPPESLELGELPEPELAPDGVRIAIAAAGLNFPDSLMIEGKYQFKSPFPFAPGMECAGTVLEVGEKVRHVRPGERVLAHPWRNCFAEQVVAEEHNTFAIPDAMDFTTAAGFGCSYGTVLHALQDRGRLAAGETLLVFGAAGGVGLNAVELGHLMGARVIAAASSAEKRALARDYGADETFDYTAGSIRETVKSLTDGRGADVIFDPVGGDITDESVRCINWNGRLLIIGFAAGRIASVPSNLMLIKGAETVGVAYQRFCDEQPDEARANMGRLMAWYEAGRLRPHVCETFPLARTVDAISAMLARRTTGKVVIEI